MQDVVQDSIWCRMTCYSQDELLNTKWDDLVHPVDRREAETHFQQMLRGIVKGYVADQRFVRRDGKILYASVSVQCMRQAHGAVDCILVLVQDVKQHQRAGNSV